MQIFKKYAPFYDSIYGEKDYPAECDFIEQIFKRYAITPVITVLDLGCGTGGHALPLAKRGYRMTGIDQSESMVASAQAKKSPSESSDNPTFKIGDIRNCDLGITFDAVISMFSVIGYMTNNEDVISVFRTARRHLKSGGLLLFDVWYGPTVLKERPSDRYKVTEKGADRIIRFTHPEIDLYRHTVQVDYKILHLQDHRVADEINEMHTVRFFFPQEIACHLEITGFNVKMMCPFMHPERILGDHEWEMAVVAEAK
jgi:SAM-dependent methyltransferase